MELFVWLLIVDFFSGQRLEIGDLYRIIKQLIDYISLRVNLFGKQDNAYLPSDLMSIPFGYLNYAVLDSALEFNRLHTSSPYLEVSLFLISATPSIA